MKDPVRARWLYGGAVGFGVLTIASIATGGQIEPVIFALLAVGCLYGARHYSAGK